jgi:hypothetical protein
VLLLTCMLQQQPFVLALLGAPSLRSSSTIIEIQLGVTRKENHQSEYGRDLMERSYNRRYLLQNIPIAVIGVATVLTWKGLPAIAADEVELPTREVVSQYFDSIRYELTDAKGGVAFMQEKIDQQDWLGLMDFTKTYDLELRKLRMGRAKKLLQDKEIKAKATEYANAVTFDLIGINRSSRQGQENVDSANKYLQELRDDVNKFLTLEKTIQVRE